MGLKNWLVKQLTPDEATRNQSFLKSLYRSFGASFNAVAFQNLNQLIREGFQKNVDVYSVINWKSEQAATIPIIVEELKGESWEAVNKNHPLQSLINKPNPYQSGIEHRQQVFGFYDTTGNAFVYSPRIEAGVNEGQALEMWIMPSQDTEIISGGWMNPILGYALNINGGLNDPFKYADVMHMKTLTLDFGEGRQFWGMSPLRAGLLALERSNSNYVYAANSFVNGGISGILETESEPLASNLSDEQRQASEQRVKEDYKGVLNNGKTMVTNAATKWHQMGFSPVDLNLLQDKRATLRDICNIYKLSSILFNDNENSTYNNVSEAKKSAYNDAIIPMVDRYVQELTDWIGGSYGDNIRIRADYSGVAVLQTDKAAQSTWLTQQVDSGQITRNESRIVQGLQPLDIEAMNVPTVTFSTAPISDIMVDPFIETEEAKKNLGKHYLEK